MNFQQKLEESIKKNNSLVCVGLDTDIAKIPKHLLGEEDSIFVFNKAIIDATHNLVSCYKTNIAFYLASHLDGLATLKKTVDYLKEQYPDIPLILDGKWADISNTSEAYAKAAFEVIRADAITVNPYLGLDAIELFLNRKDKGVIIVCRTSNPGASEFQDLQIEGGELLYTYIAKKVINEWNANNNCMLVVGVTGFEEIGILRRLTPDMFFLVPGVGAQGGDLKGILKHGLTKEKTGLLIHSARAIIYASSTENFAQKAQEEAERLREDINKYRYEKS